LKKENTRNLSEEMENTGNYANYSLSIWERALHWSAANFLPPLSNLYFRTIEVKEHNPSLRKKLLHKHRRLIYAFWHNRFLPLIMHNMGLGIAVLVSKSKDGELIAKILKKYGFGTPRGSTSRDAISATKNLVKLLNLGISIAVIPDGPRGPVYSVQDGIFFLSKISGVPILPVTVVYSAFWQLNSWDRFMIPKPFSRIIIAYAEPLYPQQMECLDDPANTFKKRLFELENRIKALYGFQNYA